MLKRRVIASVLVRDGLVVQSIGFQRFLPVGTPEVVIEFLTAWGIDEIMLLDISATFQKRGPDIELLERCSRKCLVPLAFGGGFTTVEEMNCAVRSGADKVVVNTAALEDTNLISQAAALLGTQCVIASIDVDKDERGMHVVYRHLSRRHDPRSVLDYARALERAGAGEILINAVHRDGAKTGFDLPLVKQLTDALESVVIAAGGAGHPQHFADVFEIAGANAAAAANFFHFSEHSVTTAKQYLRQKGIDVRIDTAATYVGATFVDSGRVDRPTDDQLYHMQFTHRPRVWI